MSKIIKTSNRKDTTTIEKKGLEIQVKRSVKGSNYSFPKAGVVAPGKYSSTITRVEITKTKGGKDAVDILYDLVDQKDKRFHARLRYPVESIYFGELCDALLEAGLKEGMDIKKAAGIKEEIILDYLNGETIGSITARAPIGKNATKEMVAEVEDDESEEVEEVDDDDFDDFLPDDEEDDD